MTSIINAKNTRNTRQEILQARTEKQTAKIWEIYLRQRKEEKKNAKRNSEKDSKGKPGVEKQRV